MGKALETQMNADVAQMDAAKATMAFVPALNIATNPGPFSVHLRYIRVHLRFQSLLRS
jgi:hypothetical protein